MCSAANQSTFLSSLIAEPVAPLSPSLPQRRSGSRLITSHFYLGAGLGEQSIGAVVNGAALGTSSDHDPSRHHHLFVGRHCRHGLHTPGGIGVNKAATALLLGQQGVPGALALRVAVLRRVITLWSMVAIVTINDVLV